MTRLDRLQELRPDVAAALAGGDGFVSLGSLQTLSPGVVRALAACRGRLESPSSAVLEALVACEGDLSLRAKAVITEADAAVLAKARPWRCRGSRRCHRGRSSRCCRRPNCSCRRLEP